jgi:hypothetical protein
MDLYPVPPNTPSKINKKKKDIREEEGKALLQKFSQQCGEGGNRGTGGTRQPTTLIRLMAWAYRIHMVQYETDRAHEFSPSGSFVPDLLGYRSSYDVERACVKGMGTSADPEAHVLHSIVSGLPAKQRYLLIDYAAGSGIPEWNPVIPAFRVVPSRKGGTGNLRMIWSKKRQAIGCLIEYEGIPPEEAEATRKAARNLYAAWWKAMRTLKCRLLFERRLTRWKITEIGAPPAPWEAQGNKSPAEDVTGHDHPHLRTDRAAGI